MVGENGSAGDGKLRYFGRALERREDNRLVTGREQCLDDLVVPGARHELLMEQDRFRIQALAAFDAFVPGTPLFK